LASPSEAVLHVEGMSAGYGDVRVIRDASLTVRRGEVVGLVGRNGAGKTTFISGIAGLLENTKGAIFLGGEDIGALSPDRRVRAGLALVPSGGRLFKSLTVTENLQIGTAHPTQQQLEPILALFPELIPLRARYAGKLSGGERQMVAIGRALLLKPRLLLLDEPSEGLAPIVVLRLVEALKTLWKDGMAALVAEQNLKFTDLVCHRRYAIDKGRIGEMQ
jgi:ABC-type branched-subunit amino acid transport system ATPase component